MFETRQLWGKLEEIRIILSPLIFVWQSKGTLFAKCGALTTRYEISKWASEDIFIAKIPRSRVGRYLL